MQSVRINEIGNRYGKLVVLGPGPKPRGIRTAYWRCRCDCGNEKSIPGTHLRKGDNRSCGRARPYHGGYKKPVYQVWLQMKNRCANPRYKQWKDYGGRGITVCERWQSFANFYADMGEPPKGLTLERMDNDGNYEPGDCTWATRLEQTRNRRCSKKAA